MIERRTRLDEAGAGIQLSPNASGVLIGLGLGGALARFAAMPDRLDIRRFGVSDPIATMPMSEPPNRSAPFYTLRRADLQTLLIDAARAAPGVRLIFGRGAVGARVHDDGVVLRTETAQGQSESHEGCAVIAADGLWSRLRPLVGDSAGPRFTGYEAWRALLPVERAPDLVRQPAVGLWLGQRQHVVHYPVAGGRQVNVVVVRPSTTARDTWSQSGDAADIAATLSGARR